MEVEADMKLLLGQHEEERGRNGGVKEGRWTETCPQEHNSTEEPEEVHPETRGRKKNEKNLSIS